MASAPEIPSGPSSAGRFGQSVQVLIAWASVLLLVPGFSFWLLGPDAFAFLRWWLALLVIGLAAWPLSRVLFGHLPAGLSYLPAKAVGLFLLALAGWEAGYLFHLSLSRLLLAALGLLLSALGWSRWRRNRLQSTGRNQLLLGAAGSELFFSALLLAGAFLRSFKPGLDSLEKFMNVAFINSILRSPGLPAADPWLAGETINYYYFGHYTYALLTRLTGLATPVAYNLGMATVWAFAASISWVLGAGLIHLALASPGLSGRRAALSRSGTSLPLAAGGLLSLLLVNVLGNSHAFFYSNHGPGKILLAWLAKTGIPVGAIDQAYWFPNATRFIGYNPDTTDKTIHEFPFYSYLVADLHAHVINLTVVLIFLLLLLSGIARASSAERQNARNLLATGPSAGQAIAVLWKKALLLPEIWALGFCLAIFMMQNYWDFVIYLPVAGIVLLAGNGLALPDARPSSRWLAAMALATLQILSMLAIAFLLTLPFRDHFEPMSSTIAWATARTPAWQLLVLWGPHLLAGMLGSLALLATKSNRRHLEPADGLAIGLFVYGLVLLLAPEIFYVVDIYSGDYKRANTMFKFTYQAFVLLGLCWGYLLVRLALIRPRQKLALLILTACLVLPGWFPGLAIPQWYGELSQANQQGLDGLAPLGRKNSQQVAGEAADELSDDLLAIRWLNETVQGQPVILEAAGPSYTDLGRISAFTGLPTLIGWETHEWLWRTSRNRPNAYADLVQPRQDMVRQLYTTPDQDLRQMLLAQYQVKYIVLGSVERTAYGQELQEVLLTQCGRVVFTSKTLQIIEVEQNSP